MSDSLQTTSRDWARSYLNAQLTDFLFGSRGPVKTADVARFIGDQLGASARLVRNQLNQSDHLILVERRWDLRSRHDPRRRPLEGFIRWLLKQQGRPLSLEQLATELALLPGHPREYYDRALPRLISSRSNYYFVTRSGHCGLRDWLVDLSGEDEETLRRKNFFRSEIDLETELQALDLDSAQGLSSALDVARTLLETSTQPVLNKVLGYAVWKILGATFDPLELFQLLLEEDQVTLLPGPRWSNQAVFETLQETLVEWSLEVDEAASSEEEVDLEEVLAQETPEEEVPFSLQEEDLTEVLRVIEENNAPTALTTLVTDVFELFPGDTSYIPALQKLHASLQEDDRFLPLDSHRWYLKSLLPPPLLRVPATLEPSPIRAVTMVGEVVDAPLSDEGLEGFLALEVHAPDMEDVGEENEVGEIQAGTKLVEKVRYVTSYRHYVAGTLKIRKIDRGVFPPEPPILSLQWVDPEEDQAWEVWLNNETGLLCGLSEWYAARLFPVGGVFFAEVTSEPRVIQVSVASEPDPFLFIPPARIEELLLLRAQWEHDVNTSLLDMMRHIMAEYPEGLSFRKLFSELNTIRRVTKRLVASNLSSYSMFQPHATEEGLWVYDPSKANRARSPSKREYLLPE